MKLFTHLFMQLDATMRTSEKLAALRGYLQAAPGIDAAWAVFVLTGRKIGTAVSSRLLRQWVAEASGYQPWLVDQCYQAVGDLSETLSLLAPGASDGNAAPPLHILVEEQIQPLALISKESKRQSILATWSRLDAGQRMVFHKMLTGNFRVGVSRQMLVRALAEVAGVEPAIVAHRLSGNWIPDETTMPRLLAGHDAATEPAGPYPLMLANSLSDGLASLGAIRDWQIEWKWDGIRAQIVRRKGTTAIWSRGDELVSEAFPEIVQAASALPEGTVLDGELLAWDMAKDRVAPFARLQRRLNRKSVEPSFWPDVPVMFMAFDLLEAGGKDIRQLPLETRRGLLESIGQSIAKDSSLRLCELVASTEWDEVKLLVDDARERGVEGVILKRRASAYQPGRPVGPWWKLKVQPFTMDAVLIAAEPGHGRRAGLLTDYTFGVWDAAALVPIAKAYSGLTDEEIGEVDQFARRHTIERHGPVHAVEPLRVFELGFEAIQRSTRHKSGIAVRFPRILRMRMDKKAAEADTLATMRTLLENSEARR